MTRLELARTLFGLVALSLFSAAALAQTATDAKSAPALTGHVDVVSRYILRGLTTTYGNGAPLGNALADAPESSRPALQWGADWAHPSGFYLGYFGSTINYSYRQLGRSYRDRTITDYQRGKSIENDFYGGYALTLGDFTVNVGGTGYAYINGAASNAFETKVALAYGRVTASAQTLLNDVVWGNRGDTYFSLLYTQPLPFGISFAANLGYYTYNKEGKYLGTVDTLAGSACAPNEAFFVNGCYAGNRPILSGFRHLILGFTQAIGATGLTWGAQAIIGGDNRYGVDQKNRFVATLSYGF